MNDSWGAIHSMRGVNRIVRFNEHPLPVADDMIERIRTRLEPSVSEEPYLKPGERVRITEGPFSELEAIFVTDDGEHRVVLLLNLLQQDQAADLSFEQRAQMGVRWTKRAHRPG